MQLELIDNVSRKLVTAIVPALERAQDARIAVAFVSKGGVDLIDAALQQCLSRQGLVEFLVGLDFSTTDPQALWRLYELTQKYTNARMYCHVDLGPAVVYHPKLYVLQAEQETVVIVGSSNLTEGGLERNLEVNVLIRADFGEEIVSDVYVIYNELKFIPKRVEPDREFLELYTQLYEGRKRRSSKEDQAALRPLITTFQEKLLTLRRPSPTQGDLHGWQRLIYERLPQGEFRTSDIYRFEDELRQFYPENQHIRAKIRQVLQQLRDLGLIEHPARDTWVRRDRTSIA